MGNWSAAYHLRYIGAFRLGSQSPSQDEFPAGGDLPGYYIDYAATWYHDISVGYDIKPFNTRIDIGVNNVADKQPPLLYANNTNNANSLAGVFDYLGRYYWARVTVSF